MEDFTKHSTMSNDGRFGPEKVDVLCIRKNRKTINGGWNLAISSRRRPV